MTRVLIIARAPALRAGLEAMLARSASAIVVGAAGDAGALDEVVEDTEPDVVLVARESDDRWPSLPALAPDADGRAPALVVLAPHLDVVGARDALRMGARAVLSLDASPAELDAAIAAAATGLVAWPAELAAEFVPAIASRAGGVAQDALDGTAPSLSPREIEILELLADGLANKVVAARLGISPSTVKTHVASILDKLGAGTRAEAVAIAVRSGVLLL